MYRACRVHSSFNRQILVLLLIINVHHVTNLVHSLLKPIFLLIASSISILTQPWMRYKCHVTQLPFTNFHTDSLCFVFLFYFQGDIATCAGTYLYVWSVNGQLIVKENTSLQNTNHIQCCAMSEVRQTTCNTYFKSSPRLFHFSFIYVICGTWELYLYNFPWFDTTKLCSCTSQLDFSPLFRSSGELLMTHLLLGVRGDHLVISPHYINTF